MTCPGILPAKGLCAKPEKVRTIRDFLSQNTELSNLTSPGIRIRTFYLTCYELIYNLLDPLYI